MQKIGCIYCITFRTLERKNLRYVLHGALECKNCINIGRGPWNCKKSPDTGNKAKMVVGPGNPLAKCNSWGTSFKTSFYLDKSKKN